MLYSRFLWIATFTVWRIWLRNAPGSAYANPSAHISGIVHSCPHLDYLNYICNAYRDVVGTEYVDFAHALRLRLRHRRRSRRRNRGRTMYAYVYSSVKHTSICAHALSANIRKRTHTRFHVCTQSQACVSMFPPHRYSGVIGFELRVCLGLYTHMRVRTQVWACYNTLCPVIALHISVISAALSLPLVNHGALQ